MGVYKESILNGENFSLTYELLITQVISLSYFLNHIPRIDVR